MANRMNCPFALVIMDGFAFNPNPRSNAVFHAKKPAFDRLLADYPSTTLITCGERVGLPEGQMGNSEVGHLNIGGGRIVRQELTRISAAIAHNELPALPALARTFSELREDSERALHCIGLLSTGGVHSFVDHLEALVRTALDQGARRVYVHAITDGRDRPPTASVEEIGHFCTFLDQTRERLPGVEIGIASIVGRYFAMDRDKRWERIEKAYALYTEGVGEPFTDPIRALRARIEAGATDEFMEPLFAAEGTFSRPPVVRDGDSLLFFNFRADRMREIVSAFLGEKVKFSGFSRRRAPALAHVITLTEYEAHFPVEVLFSPIAVKNHLGEVLAANGLTQLRIAETEKYAHVTYFFNGGDETPSAGEERILVPSPRDVPTYDKKPEMSAREVTAKLLERLGQGGIDVIIVNFANCDMVGHTGCYDAAVRAVETVDECVGKVIEAILKQGGTAIVTADHGNADQMVDYTTGAPHTFHTLYPVPCVLVGSLPGRTLRSGGALCDIAPTICELLGIPKPSEMTGTSLLAASSA